MANKEKSLVKDERLRISGFIPINEIIPDVLKGISKKISLSQGMVKKSPTYKTGGKMNKEKEIFEYFHITRDRLFINLDDKYCKIWHMQFSHEDGEDCPPVTAGDHSVIIPIWLLPKLKEGIEKAINLAINKGLNLDDLGHF